MSDADIDERLRAVERALTDDDTPVRDLSEAAAVHDRLDAVEAELAELGERVDALDATVQSLHGYVGDLEAVNDRVQRRADAAREAVERLEDRQSRPSPDPRGSRDAADTEPAAAHDREHPATPRSDREADDSLLDRVRESL